MKGKRLSWQQRGTLWFRLGIRFALLWATLAFWGRFGDRLLQLIMPFLLGLGMAVLLDPVIRWGQRHLGVSRRTVSLGVVLGLLVLIGGGLVLLVYCAGRELVDLGRNWDVLLSGIRSALDSGERMFARLISLVPVELAALADSTITELLLWAQDAIPNTLKRMGERAGDKFKGLPSFAVAAVMFIMGTYFLTAEYPAICDQASKRMNGGLRKFCRQVRATALAAFGGYLKAQLILSAGVFCILLLGFLLTGQTYSLLLALTLAILDFIPLLGAGTVMVPWAVFALFTHNYGRAISVMVIWGVIAMYRRVAEPKIVGDQTGLSPVVSLFSIYIGMKLAGIPGMILGPIVVLVVCNLARTGMFGGVWTDLHSAASDVAAILAQSKEH